MVWEIRAHLESRTGVCWALILTLPVVSLGSEKTEPAATTWSCLTLGIFLSLEHPNLVLSQGLFPCSSFCLVCSPLRELSSGQIMWGLVGQSEEFRLSPGFNWELY